MPPHPDRTCLWCFATIREKRSEAHCFLWLAQVMRQFFSCRSSIQKTVTSLASQTLDLIDALRAAWTTHIKNNVPHGLTARPNFLRGPTEPGLHPFFVRALSASLPPVVPPPAGGRGRSLPDRANRQFSIPSPKP